MVRFKYTESILQYAQHKMEDQETIKKIRMFGLNTYEAKLWAALLSRGISTAGELSDIANVPRSRSYDVLESLEKKGFVVMKLGKPIKYLAVPPKEALGRVKKQIEKNTQKHLLDINNTEFNNLIDTFQKIYERNTNKIGSLVAILKGRENIYKHLGFLFKDAKKDIVLAVEPEAEEHLNITNKTTGETKIITTSPSKGLRMCVMGDVNSIIFPISKEEVHPDYDLCIWIKNNHTTKFLKQLLESA